VVLAGFGRRAAAFAIDAVLIAFGLSSLLTAIIAAITNTPEDAYWVGFAIGYTFPLWAPILSAVVLPALFAFSHWVAGGRSPGKAILGIAVRDAGDAGRVPLARLLKRELYRGVMFTLLVVPSLFDHGAAVLDEWERTRHDMAADTIVVREPLATLRRQHA
jgi:uncharacterized RDD family membrane protein YckC